MRIVIDARMYHIHGGHGRYLRELIKNLEQLDTTNHYTVILKSEGAALYSPKNSNFKTVVTPTHWYTLGEQTALARLLHKLNADLVHFPHWNVPLLYRRPFIVTIHDLILRAYPHSAVSTRNLLIFWIKYAGFRVILRHALTRAQHIITVSETTRDQITDHFPELLTEITPIHLAATKCHAELVSASPNKNPNFLYIGTAYPHKNLPLLLHAFHQFGIRYGRTHQLILAGARSIFYDRLLSTDTAKTLLENDDLIYKEAPDGAALEELYTNAAAVICPALIEGFGLPALEAAARGVPVIASSIPAFVEILGDAAIYFDPHDVETLVSSFQKVCHPESRNECGTRFISGSPNENSEMLKQVQHDTLPRQDDNRHSSLLSRAAQFSWQKTAEKTLEVYQNTVEK